MFSNKKNSIIKIVALFFLIAFYLYTSIFWILLSNDSRKYIGGDFGVFYAAGKMYLNKIPLYEKSSSKYIRQIKDVPKDFQTGSRFLYPPIFALLFSPLTLFSIKTASIIWYCLSQICLFVGLYVLFRIYKQTYLGSRDYIFAFIMLDLFFPAFNILKIGQVDIIIFFLMVVSLYFLIKDKIIKSSIFISLISFIKPFFVIFPLFLILKKKYKFFIITCLTLIVFLLFSVFISGINNNKKYFENVLPQLTSTGITANYANLENSSINGFLYRNFQQNKRNTQLLDLDSSTVSFISLALRAVIFLSAIIFILIKNKSTREIMLLDFSLLLTVFFLVQNYIHLQYLIFLLIPFVNLLYDKNILKSKVLIILLTISFLMVGCNESVVLLLKQYSFTTIFYDLRIYGQVLLIGLIVYCTLKLKEELFFKN